MLDPWSAPLVKTPLKDLADRLHRRHILADQVTVAGFITGMTALPLIWTHHYGWALMFILLNRMLDGVDGALARTTTPTDAGAFLDITLDFIFYAGVVAGFALADPTGNALAAALLIFAFMGTGSSFLAFSIMAAKNGIASVMYPHKSMYYLGGITEGTETILFFILICLFPTHFPGLAVVFSLLCWITTFTRIFGGYDTLKRHAADHNPPAIALNAATAHETTNRTPTNENRH